MLGAVLVVVCALAFGVTAVRVDPRTAVLAVARPLPAGHALTDADLMVVQIVPDAAISTVAETHRSTVVGRTLRLPLAANSLLSDTLLGPAAWPPAGQSVIAVSLKPGRAPAGVAAGVQVLVMVVPASSGNAGAPAGQVEQAEAAVVSAAPADTSGTTVVSLLMTSANAVRIAGASGDAVLVVQGRAG
ncbi:SAF domain-containing protein [Phytohabitans flavus]|uniref:SAF domain-containing protein n=1 Tax=Phytohabitans flavus TaxID=1076124 RepID=UPI001564D00B|nr:SAF domain-containing protein [Phytohabitans flavus]